MHATGRLRASLAFAAGLAMAVTAFTGVASAMPANMNADASHSGRTVAKGRVLVELQGDPLATYAKTKPAQGKKINFDSNTVKSYAAQLAAERNSFKRWLKANAPRAKIVGSWDIALNAVAVKLHGTRLKVIRRAPQVVAVQRERLYQPTDDTDPDLSLISAQDAWATADVGGAANAGAGVKIAIIDTGIDITNPCFDDTGYAAQQQLGNHTYTNNKVIVAKVFNNKTVSRGYTAAPIQEHGTHVAGTAACDFDTPVSVDGVTAPYAMSGVAPAALLGNYNIFPGKVLNARSEDILNALEAAYSDGMDVANLSLGGPASGIQDLVTIAIDNLDQANMVVAVAAGNSGPGHYTVESPGSAARALTAGASTVGHFVGPVFIDNDNPFAAGLATGDFATVDADLTAPVGIVSGSIGGLGDACAPLAADLTGDIAIVSRGACTFSTKIRNAQDAGAVATIVVNNVAGTPVAMAADGTPNQPTIPAYMASLADRAALVAADGDSGTITANLQYSYNAANNNIMAGFSSQGPTAVDFRVKPDVVAPGVNVLSSIPAAFCDSPPCFAFFQGTSMATPHLAGSAAVLRGAHPDWSAAEIRSAIVNTATQSVLTDYQTGATPVADVNVVGAGLEDLLAATEAQVAIDPVSVSFGSVPSGSGQTRTESVQVTNLSGSALSLDLALDPASGSGITFSLSTDTLSLDAGASGWITVTMRASKRAAFGGHQSFLRVSSAATEIAHAAVYVFVK